MHKERKESAFDSFKEHQKKLYNAHAIEGAVGFGELDFYEFNKQCYNIFLLLKDVKTHNLIQELELIKGSNVLDVGCGYGDLLTRLNLTYKTIGVGVDISVESTKIAHNHQFEGNKYCVADAEELPFIDQSFDFVMSFDVLEHLVTPAKCITEISRVLKKDGRTLIYAISSKNKYTWHWFLRKISLGKLGKDTGSFGDHFQDHFIDPSDLTNEMISNNLKIERLVYFHSFFTLMFDEIIPKIMWHLVKRLSSLGCSKCAGKQSNLLFYCLRLYSKFVALFSPLLETSDKTICSESYSNGFYILARKR